MDKQRRRRLGLGLLAAAAAAFVAFVAAGTTAGAQSSEPASGYWMLDAEGRIYPFGNASHHGRASFPDGAATDLAGHPDGTGYWILSAGGTVSAFGSAVDHGQPDTGVLAAGESFASISPTPSGDGYWVFTDRGRVLPFGDADDHRDLVDLGIAGQLNGPIVDSVATPDGGGYYLLGSDGGVFSLGNAAFAGSMGGTPLNQPVNGLVPDPDGTGYWLVAGDGGVFAFEADFRGSMGSTALNAPVVGMVANGNGYLMVASDGGIFNFSDADFAGSLGGQSIPAPIVSVAIVTGDPEPVDLPTAGNPNGDAPIPAAAQEADTSSPDVVIGNGTPASCGSAAVVDAIARGGIITFDCGPDPITITMTATAQIFNDTGPEIVIDGDGLVTLSGNGERRILYMNTCDPDLVWTTSRCDLQDHPRLTVQNLTFVDGASFGDDPDGGGAIYVRGGQFRAINSRFFRNECDATGPDVAGGAVRLVGTSPGLTNHIVSSTFGGAAGQGNTCSNGGAFGGLHAPTTFTNSLFTHSSAVGNGANPARAGTPGGGNGGAIYGDGTDFVYDLRDVLIEDNVANEGGGAVFYVSNDRSGNLIIDGSVLRRSPSLGFETAGFPGIFYLGSGPPQVSDSVLE